MTLQPTAVYSPSNPPPAPSGQQGRTYIITQPQGRATRLMNAIPQQPQVASNVPYIPKEMPYWLRGTLNNRAIVFNAWIVAMILIGFDEWHNLNILPRPQRLWDASLLYGILVMLGFVDELVPIANALAIAFTISLLFQYFQGNLTPAAPGG